VKVFPFIHISLILTLAFKSLSFAIDKGDFTEISTAKKDDVLKCFDAKAYYLVAEKGNTIPVRYNQISKIDTPPAFTAPITRYILLLLKPEQAKNYSNYFHEKFGQKNTVRETDLPKVFEKLYNSQTNIIFEPDIVITEDPKIPPVQPEYFKDPETQKPFEIETNGYSFIPCFLLKDEAEALRFKYSKQNGKNYLPVNSKFKDFLRFIEEQLELGNHVRVFGSPAEERLKKYLEELKASPVETEVPKPS
jgi:hypothetical protein